MNRVRINKGEKFGRLKYLGEADKRVLPCGQKIRVANCLCDCGTAKNVLFAHLVRGKIKSCGCILPRHGEAKGTPLNNAWRAMKNRCSKNYFQKQYYYEKGITVYPPWEKFPVFKEWAVANGFKPGMQMDRIENSKGYGPDNCRFVSQKINLSNRDITVKVLYGGSLLPVSIICLNLGYSDKRFELVSRRLRMGWTPERAIETPPAKNRRRATPI